MDKKNLPNIVIPLNHNKIKDSNFFNKENLAQLFDYNTGEEIYSSLQKLNSNVLENTLKNQLRINGIEFDTQKEYIDLYKNRITAVKCKQFTNFYLDYKVFLMAYKKPNNFKDIDIKFSDDKIVAYTELYTIITPKQ